MELQLFSTRDGRSLEYEAFQHHELGRLYSTIPLRALAAQFPTTKYEQSGKGCPPWFSIEGGIALMILKHRYKCSDAKLIELVNDSAMLQYFCGIRLKASQRIRDKDIVGRWRRYLGLHLDIDSLQLVLAQEWKDQINHPHKGMCDATCYESQIRYPTDVKLLWECCEYLYVELSRLHRSIGQPLSGKLRFNRQRKRYLNYQRRRRKTHKKERHMRLLLLRFVQQLREQTPRTLAAYYQCHRVDKVSIKSLFWLRLHLIKRIYKQQWYYFDEPDSRIPNRIVSLYKPYIRPIVRGKENKRVEFGMKINMLQVDGIDFIEHASFDAFHEGIRLPQTLARQQRYFLLPVRQMGIDAIYGTNANRKLCTQRQVATSLVPKGRRPKNEAQREQMRKLLRKERATRMEGSFGCHKNHYLLDRIQARTAHTEIAWIFFGILTANAHRILKRAKGPPKRA